MPDQESPVPRESGAEKQKRAFIRETIIKKDRPDRKQIGLGFLLVAALAVVFGVIASLTFVLCRPAWERRFPNGSSAAPITIPRDDASSQSEGENASEPSGTDVSGEESGEGSGESTEAETVESAEASDDILQTVQSMIDGHKADIADYEAIYAGLENVVLEFNRSMVMFNSNPESSGEEVFNQPIGSQVPGVIIAVTADEVVILTDSSKLEPLEEMDVVFSNQLAVTAYRKAVDNTSRLAVYSVPAGSISEGLASYIKPAVLGDFHSVNVGNPVIAVGSAYGVPKSSGFGSISFVNTGISGVDRQVRLYVSDIAGYPESCGFFLNLKGEVIGRITTEYDSGGRSGLLSAESISDLKGYIENLSNGLSSACLGIIGTTLTKGMIDKEGVDRGIYITSCVNGGAAYAAGLQRGDILTKIDGKDIVSVRELQGFLEKAKPGDSLEVTVLRESRDVYRELSFEVQVGAR